MKATTTTVDFDKLIVSLIPELHFVGSNYQMASDGEYTVACFPSNDGNDKFVVYGEDEDEVYSCYSNDLNYLYE